MSLRHERFEKHFQMTTKRAETYKKYCCGEYSGSIDSGTCSLYGGPIDPESCVEPYTAETSLYREVNSLLAHDSEELLTHAEFIYHLKVQQKELYGDGHMFEGLAWRWMDISSGDLAKFKVGREFLWPSFVSTSKVDDLHFEDRNTLFQIDCDGLGVTYATDISSLSYYPSEQEVLIYPYSGFKVQDVDRNYSYKGNSKTLIRLEVKDTLLVEEGE